MVEVTAEVPVEVAAGVQAELAAECSTFPDVAWSVTVAAPTGFPAASRTTPLQEGAGSVRAGEIKTKSAKKQSENADRRGPANMAWNYNLQRIVERAIMSAAYRRR